MCGIIGLLGEVGSTDIARALRDALAHRGPDDAGEWHDIETGVWLGHRRLAILDLSPAGRQPMVSSCDRYVLVFNGEVYNYRALRKELVACGRRFRGSSDAEVVLEACAEWGIAKAVSRFEGMFAFAVYDRRERTLWLARDPMGIKPLYYAHAGHRFAFSSELTSLRQLSWVDKEVDDDALFSYFRYGWVPAPAAIIRGARKLESGTVLRFREGRCTLSRFWDLRRQALQCRGEREGRVRSLKEVADELEHLLRRSVRVHMQSDVPYGAFLSGGIDSSTVVALMQAESAEPVRTFSIGFPEESHDESTHARAVARHLGTQHDELILNPREALDLIPAVAAFLDEPFADNSVIPTYLVSRFARRSVAVCLSGDGGDELFGGYPRYFWASRIENLRRLLGPRGRRAVGSFLQRVPRLFWERVVDPFTRHRYAGSEGLAHRVSRFAGYLLAGRAATYREVAALWPDPRDLLGFEQKVPLGIDAEQHPELPWSEEMMLIDQTNFLQDDILTKVDRASMAVSLEARVPLLAQAVVEFSWSLPLETKIDTHRDRGKLVLREVLYRYVPAALMERPKQGFGMPLGKWLRGPLREWAESLLSPSDLEDCGLESELVRCVWEAHLAGEDRQSMLWAVLMYRQWHGRAHA